MKCDELKDYDIMDIEYIDDERIKASLNGAVVPVTRVYIKAEVDEAIAELKENHKKEVEQLLMKISGLELLVNTANKIIKQKSGFTIKDVKFGGVKLEGTNTHKKEA